MNIIVRTVFLLLLIAFFISGCTYQMDPERRKLQGTWNFDSVVGQLDKPHLEVKEDDRLIINQDFTFLYGFASTSERYTGTWKLGEGILRLTYDQQAGENRLNVADFEISELSNERLILISPEGITYTLNKPSEPQRRR